MERNIRLLDLLQQRSSWVGGDANHGGGDDEDNCDHHDHCDGDEDEDNYDAPEHCSALVIGII